MIKGKPKERVGEGDWSRPKNKLFDIVCRVYPTQLLQAVSFTLEIDNFGVVHHVERWNDDSMA